MSFIGPVHDGLLTDDSAPKTIPVSLSTRSGSDRTRSSSPSSRSAIGGTIYPLPVVANALRLSIARNVIIICRGLLRIIHAKAKAKLASFHTEFIEHNLDGNCSVIPEY